MIYVAQIFEVIKAVLHYTAIKKQFTDKENLHLQKY